MFLRQVTEEESPAKRFADQAEATAVAKRITDTPRSGIARAQFTGAWDCWLVEVRSRSNPYGNAAVLRANGTLATYH